MISYFGAKSKMGQWIYPFIPRNIKNYAEPFSGAFWIYTNPNADYSHVENVYYNDYNSHMSNLFACLSQPETFLEYIEKEMNNGWLHTNKTGDEFKQFYKDIYYSYKKDKSDGNFLDNPTKDRPNFDDGVKYAFLLTSSFNGCYPRSAGFSGESKGKIKLQALINKLKKPAFTNKLHRITDVYNLDFEDFIKKHDSEDTYFYIDPPYFSDDDRRAGWYGVKDSFTYETHMRLLKLLKTTKAKWSLSYYYFDELEQLLPKNEFRWEYKDYFRSSASFSDSKDTKGTELLIMNYDMSEDEYNENATHFKMPKKRASTKKSTKNTPTQELVDQVLEQIKLDIEMEDLTGIDELLSFCPIKNLEGYLPEVEMPVEEVDFKEIAKKEIDDWSEDEVDAVIDEINKDALESEMGEVEIKEEDNFWD